MPEKLAKIISTVFHPILMPTLGFLLLFFSGFYNTMLTTEAKRFILLVIFFSTATLPMLAIAVMAFNPKFDFSMPNSQDRIIPLLFTSVFYYIGFVLLGRIHFLPTFKLFMIASVLVIIALLLVSFKWKISIHMAAIGAVTATFFALSFRAGVNPMSAIIVLVLASGLIGTARLVLNKNNLLQVTSGYILGFLVLYPVIYFL
ncbi:phosphatase PAP2 family protein [Draconibacterium sp.]|jgi:membrane-associated phospholipid phosphatase